MKIAVGTTYIKKIDHLRDVLREIGIKAEIIPTEVESGVSDQPISEGETARGSVNRSRKALKANPSADFGLGIEVGYHSDKNTNYETFCCTSIVDKNNFIQTCFSSRYLLPQ